MNPEGANEQAATCGSPRISAAQRRAGEGS
jgi:hypothetical protein